jgi:hypothetical protein
MRILRAIVESTADLLTIGVADLIHRRRISPKPVGDDAPRPTVFLHDALEQLQRRSLLSRFEVTTASKTSPLSVRRQCALVGVARSGVYRPKPVAEADDLAVMRRIDELHLELPFYGSRRMNLRTQQGRPWGQPQAGAAADAGDGDRGAGSAPRHEQSRARAQDIPLTGF